MGYEVTVCYSFMNRTNLNRTKVKELISANRTKVNESIKGPYTWNFDLQRTKMDLPFGIERALETQLGLPPNSRVSVFHANGQIDVNLFQWNNVPCHPSFDTSYDWSKFNSICKELSARLNNNQTLRESFLKEEKRIGHFSVDVATGSVDVDGYGEITSIKGIRYITPSFSPNLYKDKY